MDNKLSKPVAWKLHHHDRYYFEENADVVAIAESMGQAKGDAVYSQEYVSAMLAELEREQEMRAQNLEIKTLLAEKVKTLETKLWDSQQLVDAKSHSQIELRSQISNLEERNRKDMSSRGKRICELDDLLEAANKRITELEEEFAFIMGQNDGMVRELEAKDKRIAELEAKTAMTMGVGSGNGNLFVHGDYDSIKAAQAIVLENESLRAKLATPVRLPDDLEPNTEPCVICGVVSSHPEGWHYCHPKCGEGDA